MQEVEVEPGVRINCYVDDYLWPWDEQTPVVLQHGFARNALFWNPWIPMLSGTHRIFRPEIRGCGRSSVPPLDYVYSEGSLVGDVLKTLDFLHLDRVHWVGESAGGRLGLLLAKHAPERLVSLVLCDTPAEINADTTRSNAMGTSHTSEAVAKYGVAGWCRQTLHRRLDTSRASPQLAQWFVDQVGQTPIHVAAAFSRFLESLDLTDVLPSIQTPTLLLAGEDSPISGAQQNAMARAMPNARLHLIQGYGHGVSVLAAAECHRETLAFWDALKVGNAEPR